MAIVTIKERVVIHHYPVTDHTLKLKASKDHSGTYYISLKQLQLVANSLDRMELGRLPVKAGVLPFHSSEINEE